MGIENYSKTPANNNSPVPNGWPEGMPPSGVNDSARQNMADLRTWYEDSQWVNLGAAIVYSSANAFTLPLGVDLTAIYHIGRRVKAFGTTTGTITGTITNSAYTSLTTVTVSWDGAGALQNESLIIYVAALSKTNDSIPYLNKKGADVASASTIDLNKIRGDLIDVTGTTAITAITLDEGQERTVRFTGILTLTNGASLVLPTGANITTAAGDFAIFRGYASGVVRCAFFSRANGQALAAAGSFTDLTVAGKFAVTPAAVTIASDAIFSGSCPATTKLIIDTEGAAASDDLATIGVTGVLVDQFCLIRSTADARNIVVKHNTGNIYLNNGKDYTLDTTYDWLFLQWDNGLSKWVEVSRNRQQRFGTSTSITANTVYQAAYDGHVYGFCDGGDVQMRIKSDSSNPPTTVIANQDVDNSVNPGSTSAPINRGDYYMVENDAGTLTSFFKPILND